MRSLLVAGVAAILVVGCGTGGTLPRGSASPAPNRIAAASPTPTFNMDDMMGFYAQQTVFVADIEKVSAVTLLNHFTRYTIPTRGKAQVVADGSMPGPVTWLYVLDGLDQPPIRLRTFDLGTGVERASRAVSGGVASTHRSMVSIGDGRVLVLKRDATRSFVDSYERLTLKPLGTVLSKPGCGDRLLASPARIAIACLETGEIAVAGSTGTTMTVLQPELAGLAGVAMTDAGAIYAVTTERQLEVSGPGDTRLAPIPWPAGWSGTVLPDGIAVATGSARLVIAQTDTDGSWLRVLSTNVLAPQASLQLAGRLGAAPQFGIVALSPFAYFASGGSVRHVQIDTGMLETMTEVGQGATIVAVADR